MSFQLPYEPVPFDETYVLYNEDDPISFLCVLFTLFPYFVMIFYVSWFLITREIEPALLAAGQVGNDIVNNIVKYTIREDRPFQFDKFQQNSLRAHYGMPSAHSQFMGFVAGYAILKLWLQVTSLRKQTKAASSVAAVVLVALVAFSRVYLYYHTAKQVVYGVLLGVAIGVSWFLVVCLMREVGLVDWVLEWRVSKMLYMKDSFSSSPVTLQDEYEMWVARKQARKHE